VTSAGGESLPAVVAVPVALALFQDFLGRRVFRAMDWGGEGSVGPGPSQQQQLRSRILQTNSGRPRRAGAWRHEGTYSFTFFLSPPCLTPHSLARNRNPSPPAESLTRYPSNPATSHHVWQAALNAPPASKPMAAAVSARRAPQAAAQVVHHRTRPAAAAAVVPQVQPLIRGRRNSLPGAPMQASLASAPASQQAALPGMTRAEIFQAAAPALTVRLQAELAQLATRVAEDSPQHLHSLRQIDDMIQEVR
jgi:hypothetical protein